MKPSHNDADYKSEPTKIVAPQTDCTIASNKPYWNNIQASKRVILIRPIYYYTYRGVSYTKNLVFDTENQLLLDIDRQ